MINILSSFQPAITNWLATSGLKILSILLVFALFYKFGGALISRIIRKLVKPERFSSPADEKQREDTLIRVFSNSLAVLIWIIALLMILPELGFNIGPVLAAVGVAGIALGFGGQYLIRDVISGTFIIIENQYRVNDVVCLDNTCGLVEDLTLRQTILRDLDGTVHHIPNGEIKKSSNLSKGFSRVNLNIGVDYASDLTKVERVINTVGQELASDPNWKDLIIKAPKFLRVDDFADSAIIIKILGDTKPIKQWDVAGELRKRLKIAFDKEGIVIPFPQRMIHNSSAK